MKLKLTSVLLAGLIGLSGTALAKDPKHNPSTGDLPPGLQKKIERGGELPPGWQKKVVVGERLGDDIYRHSSRIRTDVMKGESTLEVEGRMIRILDATREVIDILD